jgi:hypothetical protein
LGQKNDTGFDWSKTNYTSPIIRQGDFCNAGWAISAAHCLETALSLRKNESEVSPLSVQYFVGCDLNNDGCTGGNQLRAWKYVQDKGYYFKEDYYLYRAVMFFYSGEFDKAIVNKHSLLPKFTYQGLPL